MHFPAETCWFFLGSLKHCEPICLLLLSCCCPEMLNRQMRDVKPRGNSPRPPPPIPALCDVFSFIVTPRSSGAFARLVRTTSESSSTNQGCSLNANQALIWMLWPGHTVAHKPMPDPFFAPQFLSKSCHLHHHSLFQKEKLELFVHDVCKICQ